MNGIESGIFIINNFLLSIILNSSDEGGLENDRSC